MPSPLIQINELIPSLPEKDKTLAEKFYKFKDWESLKDLTWSSLIRVETAYEKGKIPDKYANIDLDRLRELAVVCQEYYDLIFPEEIEEEDNFDYSDNEDIIEL